MTRIRPTPLPPAPARPWPMTTRRESTPSSCSEGATRPGPAPGTTRGCSPPGTWRNVSPTIGPAPTLDNASMTSWGTERHDSLRRMHDQPVREPIEYYVGVPEHLRVAGRSTAARAGRRSRLTDLPARARQPRSRRRTRRSVRPTERLCCMAVRTALAGRVSPGTAMPRGSSTGVAGAISPRCTPAARTGCGSVARGALLGPDFTGTVSVRRIQRLDRGRLRPALDDRPVRMGQ